ncbi:M1 family metallopeptidase [Olivibacter sitiensis]|uniref:M1 family metallopeptidase n=1 Tax=Olivibacter sitiensis TaxID=376470 RepID=UPI00146F9F98|nr:M1 family metallopeptidase [Olivibacter sitiensis]
MNCLLRYPVFLSFLLFLFPNIQDCIAQVALPIPYSFQKALDKNTRTLTGEPGKAYWQNSAAYDIDVAFDPQALLIKGEVSITYKNDSPDALDSIWFKLYPNLYQSGAEKSSENRIAKSDLGKGVTIHSFAVNGKPVDSTSYRIEGTNMVLTPPTALMSGKEMRFSISYEYTLNAGSHNRTGKVDDGTAFVAYFFPRVAVYDDIDGWNKYPYRGSEEFYNDFCSFDVSIAVPQDFMVWATGDLLNAEELFQQPIVQRLQKAEGDDDVLDVITERDLQEKNVLKGNKQHVFRYRAADIVDFAFGVGDHYVWKSASVLVDSITGRRTRVDAVFNPKHRDYLEVIDFARKTVHGMSHVFPKWPYPFPHMTVFDGLDQMEYPMMANDNPTESREDGITLTSHEIFHSMFPFYMGTNETKYAWMDEGWAIIGEWILSSYIDSTFVDDYGIKPTAATSGAAYDTPIMTLTTDLKGASSFTNSYPKPALGYLYAKEALGDSLFFKGLHYYIKQWNGKHPQPMDFFQAMNTGSGKNLNWFWKAWFYQSGVTDLAISKIIKDVNGYTVYVDNKGDMPLPVHLSFTYEDGTIEHINYPVSIWEKGDKQAVVEVESSNANKLKKVELGSVYVPDKNKKDNLFYIID